MTDKEAIERLKRIDIRFFLSGMNEQSNYIVDEADKVNKAIETVLNLLQTQQTETLEYKKTITQDNKEYEHMKKSLKGIISRSNAEIEKKDKEILELKKENRELGNQINILTDELHKIYPPMASY